MRRHPRALALTVLGASACHGPVSQGPRAAQPASVTHVSGVDVRGDAPQPPARTWMLLPYGIGALRTGATE